jgi:hypothetical protein
MPPGYTTQQKGAIAQFMSFTSADRNTAVRVSPCALYTAEMRSGVVDEAYYGQATVGWEF